jgi:hypothetical protein
MRVVSGAWRNCSFVTGCLLLALQLGLAQKNPAGDSSESTRVALIDKARALESRGRPDMAVQLDVRGRVRLGGSETNHSVTRR